MTSNRIASSLCARQQIAVKREVHIASDCSNPPDLAQRLGKRSEFKSGTCYEVDLYNSFTCEHVQVRHLISEHVPTFISVISDQPGNLFNAVLGEIIFLLSQHSNSLTVNDGTSATQQITAQAQG